MVISPPTTGSNGFGKHVGAERVPWDIEVMDGAEVVVRGISSEAANGVIDGHKGLL